MITNLWRLAATILMVLVGVLCIKHGSSSAFQLGLICWFIGIGQWCFWPWKVKT